MKYIGKQAKINPQNRAGRNFGLSKSARKTKMLFDIETDRSQSILGQIKKCQLEFEPIILQMNISAVIFDFG